MNKIFKIVFNRERGTSIVVNEATSSVQRGKLAAVTVAVATAFVAGSAMAAEDFIDEDGVSGKVEITAPNITIKNQTSNAIDVHTNGSLKLEAANNIELSGAKNGIQFYPNPAVDGSIKAGGKLAIEAGGVGLHVTSDKALEKGASLNVSATDIAIKAGAAILNSSQNAKLDVKASNSIDLEASERLAVSVSSDSQTDMSAKTIKILHNAFMGEASNSNTKRIAVNAEGVLNMVAEDSIEINAATKGTGNIIWGVYASGEKGNANLDAKTIKISATTADSIARPVRADLGATVSLGSAKTDLIEVTAVGGAKEHDGTVGIQARDSGSSVTVKGNTLIVKVHSDDAKTSAQAIVGQGVVGDNATISETPVVQLDSANTFITATAKDPAYAAGIIAMSRGTVNVTGNLTVNAGNGNGDAILTRGNSFVRINTSEDKTVKLDGNINFDHDTPTSETMIDSNVDLRLTNADSYLNGNIFRDAEAPKDQDYVTGMKLTLANGGTWTNTAESFTNDLTLNGGVVNIKAQDNEVHKVFVNNLKGTLGYLNVDVVKTEAGLDVGQLIIDKNYAQPSTALYAVAADAGLPALRVTLTSILPEEFQSTEEFKGIASKVVQQSVDGQTEPAKGIDQTISTLESDKVGALSMNINADGTMTDVVKSTNTLLRDTLSMASGSVLSLNRILMNDVRKRLGDLRATEGDDGVWARWDGGKLSGDEGLKNDFHTFQFGYDKALGGDIPRLGFAASYTMGDTDYARGSADMDAYSLSAYSVWMADNGMFADVIARVAKVDTDMTVDGSKKGSLDSMAYSVSGEFGWRFNVTDSFYVEPQAEATYTFIDTDNMKLSNSGAEYKFDSVDSLIGRAGFAAGFKCPKDRGDVYLRVSAVHEFLGDAGITAIGGDVHEIDGKDTWVEYGIGANFNVNKNTYVYADVERTSGAALDEDWRANVGVRYSF